MRVCCRIPPLSRWRASVRCCSMCIRRKEVKLFFCLFLFAGIHISQIRLSKPLCRFISLMESTILLTTCLYKDGETPPRMIRSKINAPFPMNTICVAPMPKCLKRATMPIHSAMRSPMTISCLPMISPLCLRRKSSTSKLSNEVDSLFVILLFECFFLYRSKVITFFSTRKINCN